MEEEKKKNNNFILLDEIINTLLERIKTEEDEEVVPALATTFSKIVNSAYKLCKMHDEMSGIIAKAVEEGREKIDLMKLSAAEIYILEDYIAKIKKMKQDCGEMVW